MRGGRVSGGIDLLVAVGIVGAVIIGLAILGGEVERRRERRDAEWVETRGRERVARDSLKTACPGRRVT